MEDNNTPLEQQNTQPVEQSPQESSESGGHGLATVSLIFGLFASLFAFMELIIGRLAIVLGVLAFLCGIIDIILRQWGPADHQTKLAQQDL